MNILLENVHALAAAIKFERAEVSAFVLTFVYSDCRISEFLELTLERVDLSAQSLRL